MSVHLPLSIPNLVLAKILIESDRGGGLRPELLNSDNAESPSQQNLANELCRGPLFRCL